MQRERFILSLIAAYALVTFTLVFVKESLSIILGVVGFIFLGILGIVLIVLTAIDGITKWFKGKQEYRMLLKIGNELIPRKTETPFIVNGYMFTVTGALGRFNHDTSKITVHTELTNHEIAEITHYLINKWDYLNLHKLYIYDEEERFVNNLCRNFFHDNRKRLFKKNNLFTHGMVNTTYRRPYEKMLGAYKLMYTNRRRLYLYGAFPLVKTYN